MYVVNQILADLEEVLSDCTQATIFRRLDSALDLLTPMLPTDSNIGVMDVCTFNCHLTLPNEVEVPLAINVDGRPSDFRNKWYEHHLNGPGTECCGENCTFGWENQGLYPTFRDLTEPSQLFAMADQDEGTTPPTIKIFGEDENGKPLYSCQGDECMKPGLILPIIHGNFAGTVLEGSPKVKRIFQVYKPITCGFVRLVALDSGHTDGTLIGYYRPEEQAPAYRRIMLSGMCAPKDCGDNTTLRSTWARMRYQRRQQPITSVNDILFVPSREAIIFAVEAINQYRTNNKDEGDKYLGFARSALEEKQESLEGPNSFQAQFPNNGTYGGDQMWNMI